MVLKTRNSHYVLTPVPEDRRAQWDQFVDTHQSGHLLQSWSWGELKAQAGWQPRRLALWDGPHMLAAAQVLCRTAPHLPLRAGHIAYVPKGPVVDWTQPQLCAALLAQLGEYVRAHGALALRIEPDLEENTPSGELARKQVAPFHMRLTKPVQPLRTIVLDLAPTEQNLLAQMKEKWRYNVRLAARKGVTVRVATSGEDVRSWYTIYQTTGERDAFGIHSLDYYLHVWELFASRNKLRLFLAEHDGQLLGGIFVSLFAGQATYLYGASSNEQRQLMPNYALQWEAIRWAKEQGASSYDFWGIPDTDDADEAMAGVYRFKSGWGGRIVRFLGCYEQVYRPLAMSIARRWM